MRAEIIIGSPSETFKHVGHKLLGKLAREALNGRRIFLKECGQIGGGLVLLPKNVVLIL